VREEPEPEDEPVEDGELLEPLLEPDRDEPPLIPCVEDEPLISSMLSALSPLAVMLTWSPFLMSESWLHLPANCVLLSTVNCFSWPSAVLTFNWFLPLLTSETVPVKVWPVAELEPLP